MLNMFIPFNYELNTFYNLSRNTSMEDMIIRHSLNEIYNAVALVCGGNCYCAVYGSYSLGLNSRKSDIDITIQGGESLDIEEKKLKLAQICVNGYKKDSSKLNAQWPTITFSKYIGIKEQEFDISFGNAATIQRDRRLRNILFTNSALLRATYFIKRWVKSNKINDTYYRYPGPIAYIIMIIAIYKEMIDSNSIHLNHLNAQHIVWYFFQRYSSFNYITQCVTINGIISIKQLRPQLTQLCKPGDLVIVDPINSNNNITKSCLRWGNAWILIKKTFNKISNYKDNDLKLMCLFNSIYNNNTDNDNESKHDDNTGNDNFVYINVSSNQNISKKKDCLCVCSVSSNDNDNDNDNKTYSMSQGTTTTTISDTKTNTNNTNCDCDNVNVGN